MTKERIEKELVKVREQLSIMQAREKEMARVIEEILG